MRFTHEGEVSEPEGWLLMEGQVSAPPGSGVDAPLPRRLTFMIDTGATHCVVEQQLLTGLGPVVGDAPMRTLAGSDERHVYRVGVSLFMSDASRALRPVGIDLRVIATEPRPESVPFQGVIGLDFLRRCRLVLDGPGRTFSLAID